MNRTDFANGVLDAQCVTPQCYVVVLKHVFITFQLRETVSL